MDDDVRVKKIIKALRLKALAERGVDGEKANAQFLLKRLIEEWNITDEELGLNQKYYGLFRYRNRNEQYLLEKLIPFVVTDVYILQDVDVKDTYIAECSKEQEAKIWKLLDFYLRAYEQEEEYFFRAFIYKNELLPKYSDAHVDNLSDNESIESIFERTDIEAPPVVVGDESERRIAVKESPKPQEDYNFNETMKIIGLSNYVEAHKFSENYLAEDNQDNS